MTKFVLHTRNKFLLCMCAIYIAAFCSLYLQIPGLYGDKGILPAHTQLGAYRDPQLCFQEIKTLLCFKSFLGLNTSYMMELIALAGTFLAFLGLISEKLCNSILFALLWILYFSLFQVGQTFLHFQWDTLLLDIGFITIFVAPLFFNSPKFHSRNMVTMWVVRWALFRLMFASGVVKLQSGCPSWWGLTALNVHYESQCIPTPIAWFAHQLPEWWQKLCVVATYVIEIPIPFLFFSPIRSHRIFAFHSQILLQALIILTGNYNFFNLLTITLCLSLLDDEYLGYMRIKDYGSGFLNFMKKSFCWLAKWAVLGSLAYYTVKYFSLRVSNKTISSKIAFTQVEFDEWLAKAVPISVVMGTFSLLLTIAGALTSSLVDVKGFMKKMFSFVTVICYSFIAVSLAGISLVPYTVLHPPTQQKIWPVFLHWYQQTSDLNLASSYGLFRHMTGIGGRPEIIMEGANALEGPWIEYEFPYKPGKLSRFPPFVAPHQPRVDWQMWFAALGTYHQNPWLISMTHRLLIGEKSVTQFLARSSPWKRKSPKYIRILKYIYRYTSIYNSTTSKWWSRELEGEYMPVMAVDHPPLIDYLRKAKLIDQRDIRVSNIVLSKYIDKIREVFNVLENHVTILALFVAALLIMFTNRLLFGR